MIDQDVFLIDTFEKSTILLEKAIFSPRLSKFFKNSDRDHHSITWDLKGSHFIRSSSHLQKVNQSKRKSIFKIIKFIKVHD